MRIPHGTLLSSIDLFQVSHEWELELRSSSQSPGCLLSKELRFPAPPSTSGNIFMKYRERRCTIIRFGEVMTPFKEKSRFSLSLRHIRKDFHKVKDITSSQAHPEIFSWSTEREQGCTIFRLGEAMAPFKEEWRFSLSPSHFRKDFPEVEREGYKDTEENL